MIDLLGDTVTQPSPGMRKAMAKLLFNHQTDWWAPRWLMVLLKVPCSLCGRAECMSTKYASTQDWLSHHPWPKPPPRAEA